MPVPLPEISETTGCYKRYTKRVSTSSSAGVDIPASYEEHHEYRQKSQPVNPGFPYYCIFCLTERSQH